MPKYYRFRALTPTRRSKRAKDKESEMEALEAGKNWLTVACSPNASWSWYVRRTWWRQTVPALGLPRQLSAALRASFHLQNRPVLVVKMPASQFLTS